MPGIRAQTSSRYGHFPLPASGRKGIESWLTYHDQRFEKTHDVRMLVTLAAALKAEFANWFDTAETLTPYATAYRYPGETPEPSQSEFKSALQMAQALYQYILPEFY